MQNLQPLLQIQARPGTAPQVRVRQEGDVPVYLLPPQSQETGELTQSCGHQTRARLRRSGEGFTESTQSSEPQPHTAIEYSYGHQAVLASDDLGKALLSPHNL